MMVEDPNSGKVEEESKKLFEKILKKAAEYFHLDFYE
jgi:hypothetical protein